MSTDSGPTVTRIALSIGASFLIMNLATFVAYGSLSLLAGLEPPADGSSGQFFVSVLVVKLGMAIAFVAFYYVARQVWSTRWMLYAVIWWATFAIIEIGQAIAPNYSWMDAIGGIVAEAIYFPLAAVVTQRLLRTDKAMNASA